MHYGMAHLKSEFHANNLYKVVQLAPCFVPNFPNHLKSYFNYTLMDFPSKGVHAINGPNWEEDLEKICAHWPVGMCEYYKSLTGAQGQSVKSEQYWVMNGITDRFQEFAPNWLEGEETTDLVEMSNIKTVPMTFFVGTEDSLCPRDIALKYIEKIESPTH